MTEPRAKRLFRVEAVDADDGHVRYRRDYQGSYAAYGRAYRLLDTYRTRGEQHTVQITRSEPVVFAFDTDYLRAAS